ncbi:MAG TPA: 50S ribosomal protein L11 methyltransferase, partial [Rhodopila sp.]
MAHHPIPLETVAVSVTEDALEAYEAALATACETVGFFRNHDTGIWRVEGVKPVGVNETELASSLAVAAIMTGVAPVLERSATEADGWLARTYAAFPEQLIGKRFAVRGTHLTGPRTPNRITLTLDAGLAFGTGEHGSTRGCLVALETVARRRPRRILDMGTGSGILAMAAARLLNRPVLATDIEPWAVRVAGENAALNDVAHLVTARLADGWRDPFVRAHGPYDLV